MQKIINDLGIIITAGGSGTRFKGSGQNGSKLFATLPHFLRKRFAFAEFAEEMPLFLYSALTFSELCPDENFILVVKEDERAKFADALHQFLPDKEVKIVNGGKTRMHSVYNGLKELTESAKFAAVHDAARPLASKELLIACLDATRQHGGAVTAKRMTDTVKMTDEQGFVIKTVDRSLLWRVETPQIFQTSELIQAYDKAFNDGIAVTDDSGVMEYAGHTPFLFEHREDNRKITYSLNDE